MKILVSNRRNPFIRPVAVLTAAIFLLSILSGSSAQASLSVDEVSNIPDKSFPQKVGQILLPASAGHIEDTYQGTGNQIVIVVQDAHAIPDAQRNIEKIIHHFQETYGLTSIALEGAASRLDPTIFKSFPDEEKLKEIFNVYYSNGELTGVVAAAVFGKGTSNFFGVEDWNLYERGSGLYLEASAAEPGLLKQLDEMEAVLNQKKEESFSSELLKVDKALNAFHRNQTDLLNMLKILSHYKRPEDKSELALVLDESENQPADLSLDIEVKRIAVEFEAALTDISSKRDLVKEFQSQKQKFQTSQISAQEFALWLKESGENHLDGFQASDKLFQSMHRQRRLKDIEGSRFFYQFEKYAEEVKLFLIQNDDERRLNDEGRAHQWLRKLITLELVHEDWGRIEEMSERISQYFPGGQLDAHVVFYENAIRRDDAFFENLRQVIDGENRGHGENAGVRATMLVAGGFHAEGLRAKLRDAGISYLIVRPEIQSLPEESTYRKQMEGHFSWGNYFKSENGRVNLYKAFVRGTRDRLLSKTGTVSMTDVKGVDYDGKLLKYWRDQIIRDLANAGRIETAGDYTAFLDEVIPGREQAVVPNALMSKVERFIAGLQQLDTSGQMTEENILKLFQPAAHATTANAVLSRQTIPDSLLSRGEVRSSVESKPGQRLSRRGFLKEAAAGAAALMLAALVEQFLYGDETPSTQAEDRALEEKILGRLETVTPSEEEQTQIKKMYAEAAAGVEKVAVNHGRKAPFNKPELRFVRGFQVRGFILPASYFKEHNIIIVDMDTYHSEDLVAVEERGIPLRRHMFIHELVHANSVGFKKDSTLMDEGATDYFTLTLTDNETLKNGGLTYKDELEVVYRLLDWTDGSRDKVSRALGKAYFTGDASDIKAIVGEENWKQILKLSENVRRIDKVKNPEKYRDDSRELHKIFNKRENELERIRQEKYKKPRSEVRTNFEEVRNLMNQLAAGNASPDDPLAALAAMNSYFLFKNPRPLAAWYDNFYWADARSTKLPEILLQLKSSSHEQVSQAAVKLESELHAIRSQMDFEILNQDYDQLSREIHHMASWYQLWQLPVSHQDLRPYAESLRGHINQQFEGTEDIGAYRTWLKSWQKLDLSMQNAMESFLVGLSLADPIYGMDALYLLSTYLTVVGTDTERDNRIISYLDEGLRAQGVFKILYEVDPTDEDAVQEFISGLSEEEIILRRALNRFGHSALRAGPINVIDFIGSRYSEKRLTLLKDLAADAEREAEEMKTHLHTPQSDKEFPHVIWDSVLTDKVNKALDRVRKLGGMRSEVRENIDSLLSPGSTADLPENWDASIPRFSLPSSGNAGLGAPSPAIQGMIERLSAYLAANRNSLAETQVRELERYLDPALMGRMMSQLRDGSLLANVSNAQPNYLRGNVGSFSGITSAPPPIEPLNINYRSTVQPYRFYGEPTPLNETLDDDAAWENYEQESAVEQFLGKGTLGRFRMAFRANPVLRQAISRGSSYSQGMQEAIELKVLRLSQQNVSDENIRREMAVYIENLNLVEKRYADARFRTMGTEYEVMKILNDGKFDNESAKHIFWDALGLPLGADEMVEYAIEPSRSWIVQEEIRMLLHEIGFLPASHPWHSRHVSGIYSDSEHSVVGVREIAKYIMFTDAVLYTTQERLDYFAGKWKSLDKKGGSGNVKKVKGDQRKVEEIRLEYRTGDSGEEREQPSQSLHFIQVMHELMIRAGETAFKLKNADRPDINEFEARLAMALDGFWTTLQEIIPAEVKQGLMRQDWFGTASYDLSRVIAQLKDNKQFVQRLTQAAEAVLRDVDQLLDLNARELMDPASEKTLERPADLNAVRDLEVIKMLMKNLTPEVSRKMAVDLVARHNPAEFARIIAAQSDRIQGSVENVRRLSERSTADYRIPALSDVFRVNPQEALSAMSAGRDLDPADQTRQYEALTQAYYRAYTPPAQEYERFDPDQFGGRGSERYYQNYRELFDSILSGHQEIKRTFKTINWEKLIFQKLKSYPNRQPTFVMAIAVNLLSLLMYALSYGVPYDLVSYLTIGSSVGLGLAAVLWMYWGYQMWIRSGRAHDAMLDDHGRSTDEIVRRDRTRVDDAFNGNSEIPSRIQIADQIRVMDSTEFIQRHLRYFATPEDLPRIAFLKSMLDAFREGHYFDSEARILYINSRGASPDTFTGNALFVRGSRGAEDLYILQAAAQSSDFALGFVLAHEQGKRAFFRSRIANLRFLRNHAPLIAELHGKFYELLYLLSAAFRRFFPDFISSFLSAVSALRRQIRRLIESIPIIGTLFFSRPVIPQSPQSGTQNPLALSDAEFRIQEDLFIREVQEFRNDMARQRRTPPYSLLQYVEYSENLLQGPEEMSIIRRQIVRFQAIRERLIEIETLLGDQGPITPELDLELRGMLTELNETYDMLARLRPDARNLIGPRNGLIPGTGRTQSRIRQLLARSVSSARSEVRTVDIADSKNLTRFVKQEVRKITNDLRKINEAHRVWKPGSSDLSPDIKLNTDLVRIVRKAMVDQTDSGRSLIDGITQSLASLAAEIAEQTTERHLQEMAEHGEFLQGADTGEYARQMTQMVSRFLELSIALKNRIPADGSAVGAAAPDWGREIFDLIGMLPEHRTDESHWQTKEGKGNSPVSYFEPREREELTKQVDALLPKEGVILDLMSGSESLIHQRNRTIKAVGLVAESMRENLVLSGYKVHNLNSDPFLPYSDVFDGAVISAGIMYLTQPVKVLQNTRAHLRPSSRLVIVYSNEAYDRDASVNVWNSPQAYGFQDKAAVVKDYLAQAGGFEDVEVTIMDHFVIISAKTLSAEGRESATTDARRSEVRDETEETPTPSTPQVSRRNILKLGLAAALGIYAVKKLLPRGLFSKKTVQASGMDGMIRRAQELASREFEPTKIIPAPDYDYGGSPDEEGLVYQEANTIDSRVDMVNDKGIVVKPGPRRGTIRNPLTIYNQSEPGSDVYEEFVYDPSMVNYRDPAIKPALPRNPPSQVQHWSSIVFAGQLAPGHIPQLVYFEGVGYGRMASGDTVYGASERGFIQQGTLGMEDAKTEIPENFPELREIYVDKPGRGKIVTYQIFEHKDAVMVRQLTITMGTETTIQVRGKIIPRKGHQIDADSNFGFGFSSMYWHGEREGFTKQNAAHDSDTVTVTGKNGRKLDVDIEPLAPGETSRVIDLTEKLGSEVVAWSLEQRDQNPNHYIPHGNVRYPDRASFFVSDKKVSVSTRVELTVLPSNGEYADNVVMGEILVPETPITGNQSVDLSYTLTVKRASRARGPRSEVRSDMSKYFNRDQPWHFEFADSPRTARALIQQFRDARIPDLADGFEDLDKYAQSAYENWNPEDHLGHQGDLGDARRVVLAFHLMSDSYDYFMNPQVRQTIEEEVPWLKGKRYEPVIYNILRSFFASTPVYLLKNPFRDSREIAASVKPLFEKAVKKLAFDRDLQNLLARQVKSMKTIKIGLPVRFRDAWYGPVLLASEGKYYSSNLNHSAEMDAASYPELAKLGAARFVWWARDETSRERILVIPRMGKLDDEEQSIGSFRIFAKTGQIQITDQPLPYPHNWKDIREYPWHERIETEIRMFVELQVEANDEIGYDDDLLFGLLSQLTSRSEVRLQFEEVKTRLNAQGFVQSPPENGRKKFVNGKFVVLIQVGGEDTIESAQVALEDINGVRQTLVPPFQQSLVQLLPNLMTTDNASYLLLGDFQEGAWFIHEDGYTAFEYETGGIREAKHFSPEFREKLLRLSRHGYRIFSYGNGNNPFVYTLASTIEPFNRVIGFASSGDVLFRMRTAQDDWEDELRRIVNIYSDRDHSEPFAVASVSAETDEQGTASQTGYFNVSALIPEMMSSQFPRDWPINQLDLMSQYTDKVPKNKVKLRTYKRVSKVITPIVALVELEVSLYPEVFSAAQNLGRVIAAGDGFQFEEAFEKSYDSIEEIETDLLESIDRVTLGSLSALNYLIQQHYSEEVIAIRSHALDGGAKSVQLNDAIEKIDSGEYELVLMKGEPHIFLKGQPDAESAPRSEVRAADYEIDRVWFDERVVVDGVEELEASIDEDSVDQEAKMVQDEDKVSRVMVFNFHRGQDPGAAELFRHHEKGWMLRILWHPDGVVKDMESEKALLATVWVESTGYKTVRYYLSSNERHKKLSLPVIQALFSNPNVIAEIRKNREFWQDLLELLGGDFNEKISKAIIHVELPNQKQEESAIQVILQELVSHPRVLNQILISGRDEISEDASEFLWNQISDIFPNLDSFGEDGNQYSVNLLNRVVAIVLERDLFAYLEGRDLQTPSAWLSLSYTLTNASRRRNALGDTLVNMDALFNVTPANRRIIGNALETASWKGEKELRVYVADQIIRAAIDAEAFGLKFINLADDVAVLNPAEKKMISGLYERVRNYLQLNIRVSERKIYFGRALLWDSAKGLRSGLFKKIATRAESQMIQIMEDSQAPARSEVRAAQHPFFQPNVPRLGGTQDITAADLWKYPEALQNRLRDYLTGGDDELIPRKRRVHFIESRMFPVDVVEMFNVANLTFRIVRTGSREVGEVSLLQKGLPGDQLVTQPTYMLQVYLHRDPEPAFKKMTRALQESELEKNWYGLEQVELETDVPVMIKRTGIQPGEVNQNPDIFNVNDFELDLEGVYSATARRDRIERKVSKNDEGDRTAVFWIKDGIEKTIYLPREAFLPQISRGSERSSKADRDGFDHEFIPGYTQDAHVEIKISGENVEISDLGSKNGTFIQVNGDWAVANPQDVNFDLQSQVDRDDVSERNISRIEKLPDFEPEEVPRGQDKRFPYDGPFTVRALYRDVKQKGVRFVELSRGDFHVKNGQNLFALAFPHAEIWQPVSGNNFISKDPIPAKGQSHRGQDASMVDGGAFRVIYDPDQNMIRVINANADQVIIEKEPDFEDDAEISSSQSAAGVSEVEELRLISKIAHAILFVSPDQPLAAQLIYEPASNILSQHGMISVAVQSETEGRRTTKVPVTFAMPKSDLELTARLDRFKEAATERFNLRKQNPTAFIAGELARFNFLFGYLKQQAEFHNRRELAVEVFHLGDDIAQIEDMIHLARKENLGADVMDQIKPVYLMGKALRRFLARSEVRSDKVVNIPIDDVRAAHSEQMLSYLDNTELSQAPLGEQMKALAGIYFNLIDSLKPHLEINGSMPNFVYPVPGPDVFIAARYPVVILNDTDIDYNGGAWLLSEFAGKEMLPGIDKTDMSSVIHYVHRNFRFPDAFNDPKILPVGDMIDALNPAIYSDLDDRESGKLQGPVIFVFKGFAYAWRHTEKDPAAFGAIISKLKPGDKILILTQEDLDFAVEQGWIEDSKAAQYKIDRVASLTENQRYARFSMSTGYEGKGKILLIPDAVALFEVPADGLTVRPIVPVRSEVRMPDSGSEVVTAPDGYLVNYPLYSSLRDEVMRSEVLALLQSGAVKMEMFGNQDLAAGLRQAAKQIKDSSFTKNALAAAVSPILNRISIYNPVIGVQIVQIAEGLGFVEAAQVRKKGEVKAGLIHFTTEGFLASEQPYSARIESQMNEIWNSWPKDTNAIVLRNMQLHAAHPVDIAGVSRSILRHYFPRVAGPQNLEMALKEAVKNAVRHGNRSIQINNHVVVRWIEVNQNLILDVIDQGLGAIQLEGSGKPAPAGLWYEGARAGVAYIGEFLNSNYVTPQGSYDFALKDASGRRVGQIVRMIAPLVETTAPVVYSRVRTPSGKLIIPRSEVRSEIDQFAGNAVEAAAHYAFSLETEMPDAENEQALFAAADLKLRQKLSETIGTAEFKNWDGLESELNNAAMVFRAGMEDAVSDIWLDRAGVYLERTARKIQTIQTIERSALGDDMKSAVFRLLEDPDILRWDLSAAVPDSHQVTVQVLGPVSGNVLEFSIKLNEASRGTAESYGVRMTGRPEIMTADPALLRDLVEQRFAAAKQLPALQWLSGGNMKTDTRSEVRDTVEETLGVLDGKIDPELRIAKKVKDTVITMSLRSFIDSLRDQAILQTSGFTRAQLRIVFNELKAILIENDINIEHGLGVVLNAPGQEINLQQVLGDTGIKDWASVIYVTKRMDLERLKSEGANFQSVANVPKREMMGIENGKKMPAIVNENEIGKIDSDVAFAVSATGSLQQGQEGLEFLAMALQLVAGVLLSKDADIESAAQIKNPGDPERLKKSLIGKIFKSNLSGETIQELRDRIQDSIRFGGNGLQINREVLPFVMQYLVAQAVARAA